MKLTKRVARLVAATILLAYPGLGAAVDGQRLYDEHCSVCHQTHGRGGIGLPLYKSKLDNVSDDYLAKTIRLGRPGRIMPAFTRLSDGQVHALVGYLRSWSGKRGMSFDTAQIPGNAARGRHLYVEHCAECHADDGSGAGSGTGVTQSRERAFMVMPPAINNPGFLQAAPDAMIKHTIATGRRGSIMPAFSEELSDAELNDVVAYVRSLEHDSPAAADEDRAEMPQASHVVESPYEFATTRDNVKQALTGANFRLFPDRFLEEGLTDEFSHNPKQVTIRFCNFNQLYNMLNIEPRLGVVLPCRITVLERTDGKVVLVASNMVAISRWFNNDELAHLGNAMDEAIVTVIEEATL